MIIRQEETRKKAINEFLNQHELPIRFEITYMDIILYAYMKKEDVETLVHYQSNLIDNASLDKIFTWMEQTW